MNNVVTKYETPTKHSLTTQGEMDIYFVNSYSDSNSLYVKTVDDNGKMLSRDLYGSQYQDVYALYDERLIDGGLEYIVSPDNVTVDGSEYC